MLAMTRDGIGPVHRFIAARCQELSLTFVRPVFKELGLTTISVADFLQTHDISIQGLNCQGKVVDLQSSGRSQALHALVNVVGGHTNEVHVARLGCAKRGNSKHASAFDGEKQA